MSPVLQAERRSGPTIELRAVPEGEDGREDGETGKADCGGPVHRGMWESAVRGVGDVRTASGGEEKIEP